MLRHKFFFLISLIIYPCLYVIEGKTYKGAEYRTHEAFKYGRFEVRYKPSNREGVVSSFFTYHEIEDSTGWNEIDFEFVGRYNNTIQFNTITPGQQFHIRSQHLNFDPYAEFHEYGFEWTPDYVAWFIDGREVYRQIGDHIKTLIYPQKIMMNIWNPVYTNWVGYFDDTLLPAVSTYDYVQYSSYTPGNGDYGTDNNFTIEWKDDFIDFDTIRWEKAIHTFPGNQADFIPENGIFEEGYLKLYLTNESDIGGIDNLPPKIVWARADYDSTIDLKFSEEITLESGTNPSNYILPGGQVSSIQMNSSNNLYATLFVENYDPYAPQNLIYFNLTDLSDNSNASPTSAVIINYIDTIYFPIKVNVGGDIYADYLADQEWNSSVQYGYLNGDSNFYTDIGDIEGTDEDEIFKTERRGLVTYKFKVPSGTYLLSLLYAVHNGHSNWEGIFNIYAEDDLIESNFNIKNTVGLNSAYVMEKEVQVTDGVLDIYFEEEIDRVFVNAIILDEVITSIDISVIKNQFQLYQNYPNPFNPLTNISYTLSERSHVSLMVYDLLGKEIELLVSEKQDKGNYSISFDASHYPSGIYFYRLITGKNNPITKKMVLLK